MKALLFIIFISSSNIIFSGWFSDETNWTKNTARNTGNSLRSAVTDARKVVKGAKSVNHADQGFHGVNEAYNNNRQDNIKAEGEK